MKKSSLRLYGLIGGGLFAEDDAITAKGVAADLDRLRKEGVEELDIFLSSDGGVVAEGLAIYAQIERFPGEVTMHIDGRAISIASILAVAGKRLVMPRSALMMIHAPWILAIGNASDLRKKAADLDVMAGTMRRIYADASGLPEARVQKLMDQETWLSADEAKTMGFADEVTANGARAEAASRSSMLDFYRNTPANLRGMRAEAALAKLEGLLMRQRIEEIARSASAAAAGLVPGTTK